MANIADLIEGFILQKLAGQDDAIIIFRRNELAESIDCAPSQISYVLNTRFTVERGFIVESRRGLGGFVRIARVPLKHYQECLGEKTAVAEKITIEQALGLLNKLRQRQLMTEREYHLMEFFIPRLFEQVDPASRFEVLQDLLAFWQEHL